MRARVISTYLIMLGFLIGYANTDKYRIIISDNPATSITIAWNQISGTNPLVYFDTTDHGTNHTLYNNSQAVNRSEMYKGMDNRFVRLTGLLPNTNYYFIIKDSQSTSQRFWFRTAPNDNSRLSFIAGGDSRNNRVPRQNANLLVSKLKPHAVFFGGDMTDDDTDLEWQNWFDDWQLTIASDGRMFPIIPARGNHEDDTDGIYKLFDTPNTDSYYAITFGDNLIRAYTLNTEISVLGNQLTWLQNDLSTAPASLKWKMAQYHKPMRPHTAWKAENNNQYSAWADLFYNQGVRLVVDCDSHMAKTTWPVKPSSEPDNDEGFVVDQTNGTVYTGEGCWGAPLRPNDDDKSWTRNSGSFNQFKLIFIDASKIELRTIRVNNASSVSEVSNTDPFTLPSQLDVFNPPTGDVVTITNAPDTSCPPAYTPCDDGNPNTVYSVEDGSCNCIGLDAALVDDLVTEVSSGNDDAEETVSTGTMYLNSTDLELIRDANDQVVGVRFDSVELPDDATFLQAYVQFTSDEFANTIDPTNLIIHGELSSNSQSFGNSTNNISSRTTTSNSETWANLRSWSSNGVSSPIERTPNLVDIVNEIAALPGWDSGDPMTFIFSGIGRRVARAYEGGGAPKLLLIYLHNRPIIDAFVGTQSQCDDFDDTYSQEITLVYNNPPSTGSLNVNGQLFSIGSSPQTVTLTGLDANGLDVDLNAFFTNQPASIYSVDSFYEAPSNCSNNGIPDNNPDDNVNLALLSEATVSGSVSGERGNPFTILYNPSIDDYHIVSSYNEYGVNYNENIGTPTAEDGFKWQVNWPNVNYINYITFGGSYPNQPQPNTMWRISYRRDGNWIVLDEGQGGWIDSGIYEWGGPTENPIEADALRVQLYSDGVSQVISIHLRGRGGVSTQIDDSATTPKATLVQYLSPGNSCNVSVPANTQLYCNNEWIYGDGPSDVTGSTNIIIADGTYIINDDSNIEVNDIEIASGASLLIEEGASLTVNGDLINNGNVELLSISTKYSSLIVEGISTGNVTYKLHVNAYNGSTVNDLISSPVMGQNFGDFATTNPNLFENPGNSSQKLFGPFNEISGNYEVYSTINNSSTIITKGMGFRAARDSNKDNNYGSTLTFTGELETGSVNVPITESATAFSGWNLVGNPYSSYLDFDTFYNLNKIELDQSVHQAIYGYDGNASDGWIILNNLSSGTLIAPGQGFFVKTKTGGGTITFTPEMRVSGATDDFILGRLNQNNFDHIKLNISNSSSEYSTDFYFSENATLGLDTGYDAGLFNSDATDFSIYSNLVQNNLGEPLAIQVLNTEAISNVTIPLGVNALQGEQITVSITELDIPEGINIYLEDVYTGTFTLLNTNDYIFTTDSNISGIGRFYLRFQTGVLNNPEQAFDAIRIYNDYSAKIIIINGQLESKTTLNLYDIHGRRVTSQELDNSIMKQHIDVSLLSTGIYIVELKDSLNQRRLKKIVIK